MQSTVSEKGQVTIPKPLRDSLGLDRGTRLEFHEEDGRLVATKIADSDGVGRVFGILAGHATEAGWPSTDALIDELRGDPEPL